MLVFLGNVAVFARLLIPSEGDDQLFYWPLLMHYIVLAAAAACLTMMKYKMNLRQVECDTKTIKTTSTVTDSSSGQVSTTGSHTTKFDTATRVIAFPAYMKLQLS